MPMNCYLPDKLSCSPYPQIQQHLHQSGGGGGGGGGMLEVRARGYPSTWSVAIAVWRGHLR